MVGLKGDKGDEGPAVSFYTVEKLNVACVEGANGCQAGMQCEGDDIPIGGGFLFTGTDLGLYIQESRLYTNIGTGERYWYIAVARMDDGGITRKFHAYVVCASYADPE
jgi:hypothetical protein